MNTQTNNRDVFLIALAGALPVAWLALLIAPYWNGSIFDLVSRLDAILADPMHIQWTSCSLRAVLFCLCAYAMGIGVWLSMRRN